MQIIERRGERIYEIGAGQRILGVASIHGVPGECGRVAEILETTLAIPAVPVGAADPGDTYARAGRELRRGSINHDTDDLMAGNESFTTWPQFAFDDVQVRPAKATGTHAEEQIAGRRLRRRNLDDLQRALGNVLR
jgi:hypothetical protein